MTKKASYLIVIIFAMFLIVPSFAIMKSSYFNIFVGHYFLEGKNFNLNVEKETLRRKSTFWNSAVGTYSKLFYKLNMSSNEKVGVVGRDGFIFLGDMHNDSFSQGISRRQLTEKEIEQWIYSIKEMEKYCKDRNIPFYFIVAPAKWSIYPDKLPSWSDHLVSDRPLDQILAKDSGLPIIDLRGELKEARKIADTYSKLNTHWTDYGSYIAWQSISEKFSINYPSFKAFGVGNLKSIEQVQGYNEYQGMMGLKAKNYWTKAVLNEPFPLDSLESENKDMSLKGQNTKIGVLDLPVTINNKQATSDKNILVFMDSQGTALSPYILSSFSKSYMLNNHAYLLANGKKFEFKKAVDEFSPDVIIFVMTERFFTVPLPPI